MPGICYLIGAGEAGPRAPQPRPGDLLIAADGGYAACVSLGLLPDLVVGDFDSLGYVPRHPAVVRHPVEKDETDIALGISQGRQRGYRNFALYGCLGGRLGHTLANLQTMTALSRQGCRAAAVGAESVAACVTDGTLSFPGENTGLISVFAMGERAEGVTLRGVQYPLSHAALTCEVPLGVSNAFLGGPASVTVEKGTLLVLWEEREFDPHRFFGE